MIGSQEGLDREFDVVIVGGGSAGCVLANRLSEAPDKQVLLVEAGPDPAVPGHEHSDILNPFCLMASNNPVFHWPGLLAQRDGGLGDGVLRQPQPYIQGYGVGGASNINGMGVDRGLPEDYDGWRDLGVKGWDWEQVLPYFKRLEHDLDFGGIASMHGDDGPMPVRRLPRSRWAPFAAALGQSLLHRGFPFIEDYLSDFREGLSSVPTNCLADRRVSASMAYLTRQVRARSNLMILANAQAERLHVDGRRASGLIVRCPGSATLLRGRQFIVCCGAIQSPLLLMRSGIGPAEQLASHGIQVTQPLPGVGANLQNHPSVALTAYLPREAEQAAADPAFLQNWLRFSSREPECHSNDMHLMAFNKCAWHILGRRIGMLAVTVMKPYAKGSIELSSADPESSPKVQFNLLGDARDEERLVGGTRFALELMSDPIVRHVRRELFHPNGRLVAGLNRHTVFNSIRARAVVAILDRAWARRMLLAKMRIDAQVLLDDLAALRDFVRSHVQPQFHVCGTCRMGRFEDVRAVVDGDGQVHGIESLRVADASILPTIPRAYTHFVVLMTAEKIADAVKTAWRGAFKPLSADSGQ